MSTDGYKAQAQKSSPFIKIAGVMWLAAFMIVMASAIGWLVLAVMAGDYYSSSEAARDAAEGSVLLADLGTINAVKLWLEYSISWA